MEKKTYRQVTSSKSVAFLRPEVQQNDQQKNDWCVAHNICILRLAYTVKKEDYEPEVISFLHDIQHCNAKTTIIRKVQKPL